MTLSCRSQSTGHRLFALSSSRSGTSMIAALLVQCLLQASLISAARPTNNDNSREVGTMQSLEADVMRPGGALVRQHSENQYVHPESFQHLSRSMLQLRQHHKDQDNEIGEQGSAINLGQTMDSQDPERLDSEQDPERPDLEQDTDTSNRDTQLLDAQKEFNDVRQVSGTQEGNTAEQKVQSANNDKEEVGSAQNIEDTVLERLDYIPSWRGSALAPEDDIKMFRTASGKIGDMEESANKLQEHLNTVESAWGKVDGKLQTYHESVDDLGRQFQKLSEAAHGVHAEVKSEFWDKERIRMCSFENAKRVLAGEPEVDCNTMQEAGE